MAERGRPPAVRVEVRASLPVRRSWPSMHGHSVAPMAKYLLMSVLVATIIVPMRFARVANPRQGLRRAISAMTIYLFLWVGFCTYLFLRMGGGY